MQLRIEKYVSGGYGLAHVQNSVAFVENALPGELCECREIRKKGKLSFFYATKIIEKSEYREDPICPLYGVCGGCDFLHVSEKGSAMLKEESVRENLKRIGKVSYEIPFLPPAFGKKRGYRIRVRLHRSGKTVGFFRKDGKEVIPVTSCPLLSDRLNEFLQKEDAWKSFGKRDELSLFEGDDGLSSGQNIVNCFGYSVSAHAFFQSNRYLFPSLLSFVEENAIGSFIVDLYSGVGTFSRLFSQKDVIAVEKDSNAIALLGKNAPWADIFSQDVASFALRIKKRPDTVIVDPPRVGLSETVPSLISSWKPRRIIYISCDSTTLSRDIGRFQGYKATKGKVFDFYPGSSHEESAIVLDEV